MSTNSLRPSGGLFVRRSQPWTTQIRHATLIRRPKRPYQFTQLVTLSDGSTFLHRTTSPAPVYRSTKDARNSPLWNPSSQKLLSVEEDEAGRLAAFRSRFGRGWDAEGTVGKEEASSTPTTEAEPEPAADSLMDLMSQFSTEQAPTKTSEEKSDAPAAKGKGKRK